MAGGERRKKVTRSIYPTRTSQDMPKGGYVHWSSPGQTIKPARAKSSGVISKAKNWAKRHIPKW